MLPNPVMITGIGVVSSIGIGRQDFFDGLINKKSGIRWLSERTDGHAQPPENKHPEGIWVGGPILDLDPKAYVRPRKALKVMCREIQLAFAASVLSIEDAELNEALPASVDGSITPERIGTVFGSEMFYGPPDEMVDTVLECMNGESQVDVSLLGEAARKHVMPLWMLKYLPNMPACHVGISINAHGPNNSLVLGDVSAPAAIMESMSCLQRGIADVMICGSVGSRLNTTRMNCRFDAPIPLITDEVERSSKPHDPNATGVVGGEAAVTLVLETADHANARGIQPIAKILGTASRFVASEAIASGERSGELNPRRRRGSARAIELAISGALAQADCQASDIGLVVSHAMGDPMMDGAEQAALTAMKIKAPWVAPMAALGHTGAASGGIAVATGALAIAANLIPPTFGVDDSAASFKISASVRSEAERNRQDSTSSGLRANAEPLKHSKVLCLATTSEGNATAILLGS